MIQRHTTGFSEIERNETIHSVAVRTPHWERVVLENTRVYLNNPSGEAFDFL